jgi:hypothetical protein
MLGARIRAKGKGRRAEGRRSRGEGEKDFLFFIFSFSFAIEENRLVYLSGPALSPYRPLLLPLLFNNSSIANEK